MTHFLVNLTVNIYISQFIQLYNYIGHLTVVLRPFITVYLEILYASSKHNFEPFINHQINILNCQIFIVVSLYSLTIIMHFNEFETVSWLCHSFPLKCNEIVVMSSFLYNFKLMQMLFKIKCLLQHFIKECYFFFIKPIYANLLSQSSLGLNASRPLSTKYSKYKICLQNTVGTRLRTKHSYYKIAYKIQLVLQNLHIFFSD